MKAKASKEDGDGGENERFLFYQLISSGAVSAARKLNEWVRGGQEDDEQTSMIGRILVVFIFHSLSFFFRRDASFV